MVPKRRPGDVHQKCQSRPQPLHGAQDGEAAGWLFQVQVASRRPEPAPPTNCATRCAASRDLRHRGRHGHDPQTCQQHHHKVGRPGRLLQEAAEGGAEPWCETGPEPHGAQAYLSIYPRQSRHRSLCAERDRNALHGNTHRSALSRSSQVHDSRA